MIFYTDSITWNRNQKIMISNREHEHNSPTIISNSPSTHKNSMKCSSKSIPYSHNKIYASSNSDNNSNKTMIHSTKEWIGKPIAQECSSPKSITNCRKTQSQPTSVSPKSTKKPKPNKGQYKSN